MKKLQYTNQTIPYQPDKGEVIKEPSLTIPGETQSIREVVQRHGGTPPLPDDAYVFDDLDLDGLTPPNRVMMMDFAEAHAYKQYLGEKIAKIKAQMRRTQAQLDLPDPPDPTPQPPPKEQPPKPVKPDSPSSRE